MPSLTKCVDRDRHPILGLRMPFALGNLQMNRQDSVADNSGWGVIPINDDYGSLRLSQRGKESATHQDDQQATSEVRF